MSPNSNTEILTLTNTQAKELAGRLVTIGTEMYCFKDYNRKQPGQPPWRSGAEGKAFPLLDRDHAIAAYLKFFTRPTQKRLDRAAWLIGQQIHTWLPGLAAAPLVWVDTRHDHRPAKNTLDFAGYLARAVPGKTWLELKNSISDNSVHLSEDFRWRCIRDLILATAVLEQEGIVHGDLSPNNIVIDVEASFDQPTLYLIDFDGFVAPAAETIVALTVAEGGTYGTEGYCPADLAAAAAAGESSVAPYSDRYGRDMLLTELLAMDCGLSPDDPPTSWPYEALQRRFAARQARDDTGALQALSHLEPTVVFTLEEQRRPASTELATGLGLSLPAKRLARRATRVWSQTPAVLGHSSAPGHAERVVRPSALVRASRTPATLNFIVPWRWSRPESDPGYSTVWQDIKMALGCATIILLPGIMALIILLSRTIFDLFNVAFPP